MAQYKGKSNKGRRPTSSQRTIVMWRVFGAFWAVVLLFFLMLSLGWLGYMPSLEELENPRSNLATEVFSDDGQLLGMIGVENRSYVSYDSISLNVINALIATEDVRFRRHSGIDARSLGRVLVKTVLGRHSGSGGGSTITQQLAKNMFPVRKGGKLGLIVGKFKEWVIAVRLEHRYSKDEIIAMYLNTVDFGANSFGIKTAAFTFFGKSPDNLTVEEAAVLVGLLKAPTAYNPKRHHDASITRRNVVLSQMNRYEVPWVNANGDTLDCITDGMLDTLQALDIDVSHYRLQSHNDGPATYLREYVRNYMNEWCKHSHNGKRYDLYKDGLKVYTTVDSRLQRYAEEAVSAHMGGTIQPAFFNEVKKRKGNPFVNLSKEQEQQQMNQAMKLSDRYRNMKKSGCSDSEIKEVFNQKRDMTVFVWDGSSASSKDTVMSPWDSLLYYKKYLNAALMSVEPGTGYVRAYVGGISYRYFKYDNAIQGTRQVGSTFKPFVYAMALQDQPGEGGWGPCTQVPNTEVCFETASGTWCPKNSSHEREGEMVNLRWGLANSINWISAYLMKQGSPESVISIARRMGVVSPIDPVPAICVGTPEITVYEMAGAMAALANGGDYVQPIFITRIENKDGEVIETFPQGQVPPALKDAFKKQFGSSGAQVRKRGALADTTSYILLNMMQSVVTRGTGSRLSSMLSQLPEGKRPRAVAGKTGTTQHNSDCWFVGITPNNHETGRGGLATVVWTGGEVRSIHFRSMEYGQGARMALPICGRYFQKAFGDGSLGLYRGGFTPPATAIYTFLGDCTDYEQPTTSDDKITW